jgi:hypothetical protein
MGGVLLRGLALLLLVSLVLPASADAKTCAERVIDDWYDNYRVDGAIYEERCYREAVASLGLDLRDYGTAEDDILRALAYARRGELDPGDGTGGPPDSGPSAPAVAVDAAGVPAPLLVLGGLGLALLLGGGAATLRRRSGGSPPAA